jgi:hypothetical protein
MGAPMAPRDKKELKKWKKRGKRKLEALNNAFSGKATRSEERSK